MIEMISEGDVYSRIGEEGFQRLVAAFYAQVPGDDILGPMYPKDDIAGAEERLRDFLEAARDRWVQLMDRALDQAELPADAAKVLRDFFHHMATFLMNAPGAHGH
jgi:hemoglobin